MAEPRPVTVPELLNKKERGERIVVVTAYDYPSALWAAEAGVDAILVGDSVGMVVQGSADTLSVTLDHIAYHTSAVRRAQPAALLIADLPFLTYQVNADEAVRNAGRLLQAGAQAVKLEGGAHVAPLVRRLVESGIPVMGHLGLTPQSVHAFGGFRLQARQAERARQLLEDARALEEAGAFGIVLEVIPAEVSRAVTAALRIPTIGIGAGPHCDGQVQVLHDLLGMLPATSARHAKRYAELGQAAREAMTEYAREVREGTFPTDANTFHQRELEDPDTWSS